jgi:predicted phosphate transport protein (TIGR00153 family)
LPLTDFFSFLGSGERQIVNQIQGLLDISSETARHVLKQVELLKNYDYEGVDREFEAIDDLKTKAYSEHRSLVRLLSTGSFFGGIREDLLSISEMIVNIADTSKRCAMIFHDMQVPKEVVDYFFQGDVEAFLSTCINATELLKEAIAALEKNKNEVLSLTEKVEEKEADADDIHHSIVRHLYRNEINAKSLDIIVLTDFLHIADDIADYSEEASDVLVILIAKGYS